MGDTGPCHERASASSDERAEFIDFLNFTPEAPEQSPAEVRYEWSWPDDAKRWSIRRTGGGRTEGSVPDEVLQAIPVTMQSPHLRVGHCPHAACLSIPWRAGARPTNRASKDGAI
jgi:hypothetical protein